MTDEKVSSDNSFSQEPPAAADSAQLRAPAGAEVTAIKGSSESALSEFSDMKAEMQGPNLIDDELTQQLIDRGAKDWPSMYTAKILWIIGLTLPPAILSAFFGYSFFQIFFGLLFFAWLTGTVMARQITSAMKNRHYTRVVRMLPNTLYWTTMWYPYTHNSHIAATDAFVRLLMLEGRFVEFQAVTLYSWGLIEPHSKARKNHRRTGASQTISPSLFYRNGNSRKPQRFSAIY